MVRLLASVNRKLLPYEKLAFLAIVDECLASGKRLSHTDDETQKACSRRNLRQDGRGLVCRKKAVVWQGSQMGATP
jgi:hypothetical protein